MNLGTDQIQVGLGQSCPSGDTQHHPAGAREPTAEVRLHHYCQGRSSCPLQCDSTVEILITHSVIQTQNPMHYQKYARRRFSQGSEISDLRIINHQLAVWATAMHQHQATHPTFVGCFFVILLLRVVPQTSSASLRAHIPPQHLHQYRLT